jgi:hypothetical protein
VGDAPKKSTPPPGYESLPSAFPTDVASPPPQPVDPPLDPFSRRLLQIAGVLAVLVILVALNSLLQDDGESPFSPNPIAAAAERASTEPGGRMTLDASYAFGTGQTMTMSGAGAYDPLTESAQVKMTMQAPAPVGSADFEILIAAGRGYVRSSLLSGSLPPGKEWIGLDSDLGASGEATAGTDPSEQLELLREVGGQIETLGRERVRGVTATRYRGAIPLGAFAEAMRDQGQDEAADAVESSGGRVSAEAWIDARGRIRQMRILMSVLAGAEVPAMSIEMRMEFFDFGAHPVIAAPDPAVVLDAGEAGIDPELLDES